MGFTSPNPIDIFVGGRIRFRRTMLGMSEDGLAGALGVAPGQIRKYEEGVDRVSASRLHDIADVLDVHFSFFFKNSPPSTGGGLRDVTDLSTFA
ncbi:helix-turn-helix domain-containing protein [Sinorhizobium numidicum]|uniref:Helix-turn-helix domain-containing protein n=1 Tax=Sinorhizobium numidicum TaxID=680248 RepID=A0ABY8CWV3_9HYPH|nr:helix-turn-helix transcriptional regulator [Sinorhizobium numidicum]WEX76459.1 helix-turn-helix domain-containing protein [Sinorhizobium numidicum]WEX83120.1 helix-turn-helix domain-containing protein [Sinorhizobium numidicum]